ncbi:MAG: hypothetical protein Q8Q06_00460 [bacterium]|nr:hypothetical protein [bacterium]
MGPSLSIKKDFFLRKVAKLQAAVLAQAIGDLAYGWGSTFYNARTWVFGETDGSFMRDPFSFIRICHETERDPEVIRAKILSQLSIAKREVVINYWQSVMKNNSNYRTGSRSTA